MAVPLQKITSPLLLKNKILGTKQSEGQTYTGDALALMQQMFNEEPRNGKSAHMTLSNAYNNETKIGYCMM